MPLDQEQTQEPQVKKTHPPLPQTECPAARRESNQLVLGLISIIAPWSPDSLPFCYQSIRIDAPIARLQSKNCYQISARPRAPALTSDINPHAEVPSARPAGLAP